MRFHIFILNHLCSWMPLLNGNSIALHIVTGVFIQLKQDHSEVYFEYARVAVNILPTSFYTTVSAYFEGNFSTFVSYELRERGFNKRRRILLAEQ